MQPFCIRVETTKETLKTFDPTYLGANLYGAIFDIAFPN